jgi:hypothetical protein
MRIAVDIQALQTVGSRERGVGRYTFCLLRKLLELDLENEYILIAIANLGHPKIDDLPSHRLINLFYPEGNDRASEIIMKTALLAGGIDIFHIASPMEL